jgi:CubicO group peptidase (beta-lactamase class C family)
MKNQLNIYVEEACRKGLSDGVFYGVSAAVSMWNKKGRNRGWYSGGMTRFDLEGVAIQKKTLFDLASLTKPLCTTLSILHLIATGKLHWDEACLSLLDLTISPEKNLITVKNILNHSSGLPSYKPYFEKFFPEFNETVKNSLIEKILEEPLEYLPATTCRYSDLGFILLGKIIERLTNKSLDIFYKKVVTDPLKLSLDLCFLPHNQPSPVSNHLVAATELCGWRNRIIQGEVHDEHCCLLGGVSGHAGLFGNVESVLTLCELILDIWKNRASHPTFPNTLLQQALTTKHPTESWCLGFDTPSPGLSSSGRYFSSKSVGHLGFSGTSFWIDPERDIIIILLTNRIHPSRENIKIRQFRPFFHDYLMERMISDCLL